MALRDSIGVCAIVTPWNFPIAIPSWKIFPAIVAGNTVVFKPSPETPALGAAFVKVMEATVWAAFGTAGQRCTACLRLIVQKGVHHKLVDRRGDSVSVRRHARHAQRPS